MKNASSNDSSKKNAGYKAAEYVEDGMVLGLGTGSTTHFFIEKVGMRIRDEGISVMGIPTSFQSLLIAKKWNANTRKMYFLLCVDWMCLPLVYFY